MINYCHDYFLRLVYILLDILVCYFCHLGLKISLSFNSYGWDKFMGYTIFLIT
jgi:hypothetical protein